MVVNPTPEQLDLSLTSLFAGWAMADEVQRRLAAEGHVDLRFNDGVVFQHVLAAELSITGLAARMGVTQQAASKAVTDLERRGLLDRVPSARDARSRLLRLTPAGRSAVDAARRHRADIEAEMVDGFGAAAVAGARELLAAVIHRFGAADAIRSPPGPVARMTIRSRVAPLRKDRRRATITPMDVVEFRPEPHQFAWTFGGAAPTHRIRPGTALKLWTEDAFSGRLQRVTDMPSQVLDMTEVNPQTGPFYVEGAEPGDTLAIHIVDLTPARDWAASTTIPFFGALTHPAVLHEPLPERTWIYQLDRAKGTVLYEARNLSLELPIAPMLGTVGVAPAGREVRTSLVPDRFGGNMDTPEMKAGTTCFLGVNVEGALFSLGDGHYRQGEGESCGTAVEGAMDVTVIVDLVKGGAPEWPRLEHDDHYVVVGSARPLEDAWRASQMGMVAWLGELYGLDRLDAYQLLTQISLSPLANVVDANYSAVTKVEKALLPATDAYGGMHRHLRSLSNGLI